MDIRNIWPLITENFPVLDRTKSLAEVSSTLIDRSEFTDISKYLADKKFVYSLHQIIVGAIEKRLRVETAPAFWVHFSRKSNDKDSFLIFYDVIDELHSQFLHYTTIMQWLKHFREQNALGMTIYNESEPTEALKIALRSTLMSQIPSDEYQSVVLKFYKAALEKMDDNVDRQGPCVHCTQTECCRCNRIFDDTNEKLRNMALLESLVGQPLSDLIYQYIRTHIKQVCWNIFDQSFIQPLESWLQSVVIAWVRKIYVDMPMAGLEGKLINFLYNTYAKARIDQLFNIIIEFPESMSALRDLHICLPKTDLKSHLTSHLIKQMKTRLLHSGVSTSDILTAYIAAIRSLRILDPSGLLLLSTTAPVHQYLRSREDTVRCVVSSLTEDGPNDLADELARGSAPNADVPFGLDSAYLPGADIQRDAVDSWQTWVPDPTTTEECGPAQASTGSINRNSDIISMLINLYGSKELFVNEYRALLADRLLAHPNCDTTKELRYLELLKLRFGDSQLHYCEVMLKDVADSKRFTLHVKQEQEQDDNFDAHLVQELPLSVMIVSAQFWPALREQTLNVHEKVQNLMHSYNTAFENWKGSRTLNWKHYLGVVEVEIEWENKKNIADAEPRIVTLEVTPLQATILMYMEERKRIGVDELSKLMHISASLLRRNVTFWKHHGVVRDVEADVFELVNEEDGNAAMVDNVSITVDNDCSTGLTEDGSGSATTTTTTTTTITNDGGRREDSLNKFWSYIVGMLVNLDALPLERIHQMLKMFAFGSTGTECSLAELKVFLERKVRAGLLVSANGMYSLPKT